VRVRRRPAAGRRAAGGAAGKAPSSQPQGAAQKCPNQVVPPMVNDRPSERRSWRAGPRADPQRVRRARCCVRPVSPRAAAQKCPNQIVPPMVNDRRRGNHDRGSQITTGPRRVAAGDPAARPPRAVLPPGLTASRRPEVPESDRSTHGERPPEGTAIVAAEPRPDQGRLAAHDPAGRRSGCSRKVERSRFDPGERPRRVTADLGRGGRLALAATPESRCRRGRRAPGHPAAPR
jgi:hypothetical protein